jgi:NAD(P)H-quinone oxidoreductase subunit 4
MVNRVFFGRLSVEQMPQVKWRDRIPAVILTVFLFLLGLQPNLMVRWSVTQATDLVPAKPITQEVEAAAASGWSSLKPESSLPSDTLNSAQ